ncbi:hypothetical protein AVEN_54722-1 [Araneus ventricosus]|uniref:Uncharacterized protein n=1 Tax=Araneus ventricosus TaxID=182803 RepID=A0A4Y2FAZ5_ARAVE|nr:hypothetical protein AVEN_54722-1 [Araneus ventricosus]
MNKFIVCFMLCMLIAINCQMVNSCPPCKDVGGEKRYCVKTKILNLKVCEAGSQKGGRCTDEKDANGVYQGLPPCKEGLTCSAEMGKSPKVEEKKLMEDLTLSDRARRYRDLKKSAKVEENKLMRDLTLSYRARRYRDLKKSAKVEENKLMRDLTLSYRARRYRDLKKSAKVEENKLMRDLTLSYRARRYRDLKKSAKVEENKLMNY